jgi:hypothetical protein
LATGEYIGDKLVMFDLSADPYSIDKGSDRTFKVSADIGGQANDTIVTYLDNSADLYVVGDDYGFGVTVTDADFDTSAEGSSVTIQGGELSVAFSGPSAKDISNTAEDVSFYEGTLTAELALTITAMPVLVTEVEVSGGSDSTLEEDPISDIRIVNADTGELLMGPLDLASTTNGQLTETLAFTDDFDMAAGETLNFKITADMESTADATDTFTFTLNSASGLTAEDMSGDAITDIVPNADLAGSAQTVVASGLTVSLASTPSGAKTYVRGTSDVTFASFNFAAANGGAIEVTDFSPTIVVASDDAVTWAVGQETTGTTVASTDRITSCSLYSGSTLVSGPESIVSATSGKVNFENFSYDIAAGSTATLTVKCSLANVNPGTNDAFAAASIAPADVTALDSEGDSATVTGTSVNSTGTSVPSTYVVVTNSGSLAVVAASDTPDSDFLLTGSTSNTVSKYRFNATSEAFVVDRLTVEERQATTDGVTDTTYANDVSLVTVSYPDSTGATKTASGALTGMGLTLNGLTFYVGKDTHADLTIKVDVPSTDRSGGSATSNERVRMVLDDGTGELRAVGQGSGQTLADNAVTTVDTAATSINPFVVRETKPTISLSSSSPSGAKVPGNQESLRFNVAAASGQDVVLNNILFTFSSTDNATSGWNDCDGDAGATTTSDFRFYDSADLSTAIGGTYSLIESNGTLCDGASSGDDLTYVKLALTTGEVVAAGTTKTYELFFDSTGASSVNDDSIQIGLAGDAILSAGVALGTTRNTVAATATTNTLTGAAALDTTADSAIAVGDIVYETGKTERMLVVAYTPGASTATVLRGYMGTTPQTMAGGAAILRMPGALLWQDDGSTAVTNALQEYYGAHLVDNLAVTGNSLSF